jgi:type VI secretion system secreted protein VgrG
MKRYVKNYIPALVMIIATVFTYTGVVAARASVCAPTNAVPAPQPIATALALGSAGKFGVIAAAAITNGGGSHLNGNIGVSPGTAITGIATIFTTNYPTRGADPTSTQGTAGPQSDLITADSSITAQSVSGYSPIAAELGSQLVCPGIYKSDAAFGLTGTLTLDGNGNSDSIFIFITPAALTSAAASKVILQNGAEAKNVYWQLGAAATLGASSFFKGTILAQAAITTGAGVHVHGRLFSMGAAITLDSTCVVVPDIAFSFDCSEG